MYRFTALCLAGEGVAEDKTTGTAMPKVILGGAPRATLS